jgi:hypothetical protein
MKPSRKGDQLIDFFVGGVVIFLFLWCERALRSRVTLRKEDQVASLGRGLNNLARHDVGAPPWMESIQICGMQRFTEPFCSLNHGGNSPSLNAPSRDCER